MLHVAYHGAEHYNSIRCADDDTTGVPPRAVEMAAAVAPAVLDAAAVRQVMQGTGVWDEGRVGAALEACRGDVDQVGYTGCVVEGDSVTTLYRQWSDWWQRWPAWHCRARSQQRMMSL